MTTILPSGAVVLSSANGNAKQYIVRAQAQKRVDALGDGWRVREPGPFARGFMVERVADEMSC